MIVIVRDAIHNNINAIPQGILAALYTTGSPDIKATANDFAAHPNAIHICQDHGSDVTADILDMENGAATIQDVITWLPKARDAFTHNVRHGQRWPGVYLSRSRVTEQANALVAAHDTNIPLWVANWGESQANADAELLAATQPFPIVGLQIANLGTTDFSLFSSGWLNFVSGHTISNTPAIPPGQWKDPKEWTWKDVTEVGIGMDDKQHSFAFNPATGQWSKTE